MTVTLKELDGARDVELECVDEAVYLEGTNFCYQWDRGLFIRALERALGVVILEDVRSIHTPGQGNNLRELFH